MSNAHTIPLIDPTPLTCQSCFDTGSLIPTAIDIDPVFVEIGQHLDLLYGGCSTERPRVMPPHGLLLAIRLHCRRPECEQWSVLVLTGGQDGAFIQLHPFIAQPEGSLGSPGESDE